MIINEVKVTERGWAGHFILADRCLFRRNTLLEYKDKKWVVSTVGAYRNRENKMDSIGYCRWYETGVFEAYEKNGYINTTDFTLFLEDKTSLINETLRIDDLKLPNEINDDVINDYINTIDEGLIKKEIENIKNKISNETNVAKKVVLLEKLRSLKKKECK